MDILQAIGNTSMVQLRKIVPPGHADIFVKLEWENPTGSMKDRMALAMVAADPTGTHTSSKGRRRWSRTRTRRSRIRGRRGRAARTVGSLLEGSPLGDGHADSYPNRPSRGRPSACGPHGLPICGSAVAGVARTAVRSSGHSVQDTARVGGVLLWGVLKVCGMVGLFGDDFSALFGTVVTEALNAVVTGSVHDLIRGSLMVSLGLFGLSLLARPFWPDLKLVSFQRAAIWGIAIQAFLLNAPSLYTTLETWRVDLAEEVAGAISGGSIPGCSGDVVEVLLCVTGSSPANVLDPSLTALPSGIPYGGTESVRDLYNHCVYNPPFLYGDPPCDPDNAVGDPWEVLGFSQDGLGKRLGRRRPVLLGLHRHLDVRRQTLRGQLGAIAQTHGPAGNPQALPVGQSDFAEHARLSGGSRPHQQAHLPLTKSTRQRLRRPPPPLIASARTGCRRVSMSTTAATGNRSASMASNAGCRSAESKKAAKPSRRHFASTSPTTLAITIDPGRSATSSTGISAIVTVPQGTTTRRRSRRSSRASSSSSGGRGCGTTC